MANFKMISQIKVLLAILVFAAGAFAQATDNGSLEGTVYLSADGTTLAVGAYLEDSANGNLNDNSASDAGAVYLY